MAFTVEDGTGIADANSYVTVEEADAYHSLRPSQTQWGSLTDPADKQRALVIASDFIDDQFGSRFKGAQASSSQGLAWPRSVPQAPVHFGETYAVTADFPVGIVPKAVKRAVFELAVISIATDFYAQKAPQTVVSQSIDVIGPLTKSRSYSVQPLQPSSFTVYADKVSSILGPLLDNAGLINMPVGRA